MTDPTPTPASSIDSALAPRPKRRGRPPVPNAKTIKLREKALNMRVQGWSYIQIAEALGITKQYANQLVTKELELARANTAESVAQLKKINSERYEKIIQRLWIHAMPPGQTIIGGKAVPAPVDLDQLDKLLRTIADESKLLGLNAPDKIQLVGLQRDVEEMIGKMATVALRFIAPEDRAEFSALIAEIFIKGNADGTADTIPTITLQAASYALHEDRGDGRGCEEGVDDGGGALPD